MFLCKSLRSINYAPIIYRSEIIFVAFVTLQERRPFVLHTQFSILHEIIVCITMHIVCKTKNRIECKIKHSVIGTLNPIIDVLKTCQNFLQTKEV